MNSVPTLRSPMNFATTRTIQNICMVICMRELYIKYNNTQLTYSQIINTNVNGSVSSMLNTAHPANSYRHRYDLDNKI